MVVNRVRYLLAKKTLFWCLLLVCTLIVLSDYFQFASIPVVSDVLYNKNTSFTRFGINLGAAQSQVSGNNKYPDAVRKEYSIGTQTNIPRVDPAQVVLVLKTGHAVYQKRLASQLATFASARYGRSSRNTIIISDHNDTLGDSDLVIHDVVGPLGDVPQIAAHRKFAAYLDEVYSLNSTRHSSHESIIPGTNNQGWVVDALKFIPGYQLAAESFPDTHWFLGVDDDTYVVWENVMEFLSLLDHTKEHYLGTPAVMVANKVKFHHGGSIIVLSQAAMRTRFIDHSEGLLQFNLAALELCCGDGILSMALGDVGIQPDERYRRLFNGQRPEAIKVTKDNFCLPILGLHHADSETMLELGNKLMKRDDARRGQLGARTSWGQMLRIIALDETEEVEQDFDYLSGWDFLMLEENEDRFLIAADNEDMSATICRDMCKAKYTHCLGWLFVESTSECWLSKTVSPGVTTDGTVSGLNVDTLDKMEHACQWQDWQRDVRQVQIVPQL